MSIQRSLIAFAVAFAASTSACYAGPCSQDIARLQAAWNAKVVAAFTAGTAESDRWTPEQAKAFTAAMARAREADSANDESACKQAVADAEGALSK